MARDKYGHYVNEKGVEISARTSSSGNEKVDFYDKCAADPNHGSIHINWSSKTGKGTITDTTEGKSTTTPIGCFLTSACLQHFKNEFDDNCYELTVLRWFRDNFVLENDIVYYYQIAPIIVEAINNDDNNEIIYDYIYENVVNYCVNEIEKGNYEKAYNRYRDSIIVFEEKIAKPYLQEKLVMTLKLI